jgi:hypothetical protein
LKPKSWSSFSEECGGGEDFDTSQGALVLSPSLLLNINKNKNKLKPFSIH